MKRSILKLEAVGNSGLISTSRAIIKTQQKQAIADHLTLQRSQQAQPLFPMRTIGS